jgi:glutamate racemase
LLAFLDSGIGGLTVARSLQALRPDADILYLADRAHAPYGTKSERELLAMLERAICALLSRGADRVVLACITASCLYDRLPRDISPRVIPILPFVAEEIARQNGHVGMIATEATVKSDAPMLALRRLGCTRPIERNAAQALVALAEAGRFSIEDGAVENALTDAISPLVYRGVDTLVLGCTHFPYFENAIRSLYGGLKILSPARIGSEALVNTLPSDLLCGEGRFSYLVSMRGGRAAKA